MTLVSLVYQATKRVPEVERFGLTSQIQRCAVSTPSNIAEGRSRGSRKDFVHFLHIALGSSAELETQFDIAKELSFVSEGDYTKVVELIDEVRRMLVVMIPSLRTLQPSPFPLQS